MAEKGLDVVFLRVALALIVRNGCMFVPLFQSLGVKEGGNRARHSGQVNTTQTQPPFLIFPQRNENYSPLYRQEKEKKHWPWWLYLDPDSPFALCFSVR